MRKRIHYLLSLAVLIGAASWLAASPAAAQDDADTAAIKAADEQLIKAFNAGKVDELTAMFLPKGELVDEEGLVYQGQAAIKDLLTKYFAKFPGAKLTMEVDSIRIIGPVAFEEGTRTTTTKDDAEMAQVQYSMIR